MNFEKMINTIQLGDCYELIKQIPDKSIDLVYIDIPYMIVNGCSGGGLLKNETKNKTYKETIGKFSNDINWDILDQLTRVLKHIYIYIYGAVKSSF